MEWIILIIVALVVAPLIGGAFHSKEREDQFVGLGEITGRPIEEIIERVGKPNAISGSPDGTQIYQWVEPVGFSGTHYAIIVDADGLAIGYSHQSRY